MVAETLATPSRRLTPLVLWHLASLDAPTVGTLWTIFAAHALHQAIAPTLPPAMFLSIWIIYATDRLLDTRNRTHDLEPRHHFHHAHRTPFAIAILVVTSALTTLIPTLPPTLLHLYLALAALLLVWFALIHLTRLPLPKEFAPGPFFAAAVFIPIPHAFLLAILFAALCTLNCLYIHAWEHPPTPRVPLSRRPTAPALRHLPELTLALVPLSLAAPLPLAIAISLSALALLFLHHHRLKLAPTTLRAAADLALLTPVLVLPFLP